MVKTTVYLSEEEREMLRRASARSGNSQSDLLREGVRLVTERYGTPGRQLRLIGAGRSETTGPHEMDADEIYRRKVLGQP